MFFTKKGTGALLDTRTAKEKLKDYRFEEIVASVNPVNWVEKPQSQWRKFPVFNQNGSGSCVAQTLAKLLGILYWLKNGVYVHFSSTHIYQRRLNKTTTGMGGVDAFDIARNGVTLEELVPSQNMTDVQMDNVQILDYKVKVGEVFKIPNYVILPIKDIDTIASVIQTTGKGVMVWFYWKIDEWVNVPIIKYPYLDINIASRHSVTAIDFTLYEGEKALIIDDSWGSSYGVAGQRVIKESFFKERNFFAAYPLNFVFDEAPTPNKPTYKFSSILKFGETNEDIKNLQNVLKYEGLFPNNVESTGYYGAVTAKGVLGFQQKYNVAGQEELSQLNGRLVGDKTIKKLNELYG